MTSTVLFIPLEWEIGSAEDIQYQTLLALLSDRAEDTPVRGSWERELSRIASIQKHYVLAPWTGNPLHSCELPYVVLGSVDNKDGEEGNADVFIKEAELPEFLVSIKDVLRILKAKGRIRLVKWPHNFRG